MIKNNYHRLFIRQHQLMDQDGMESDEAYEQALTEYKKMREREQKAQEANFSIETILKSVD